jgi:hypothetical protein
MRQAARGFRITQRHCGGRQCSRRRWAGITGRGLLAVRLSILREDELSGIWIMTRLLVWLVVVLLLAWHAYRWPARAFEHTSYRVDAQGIEVRRGLSWRVVINVPRSRAAYRRLTGSARTPLRARHAGGLLRGHRACQGGARRPRAHARAAHSRLPAAHRRERCRLNNASTPPRYSSTWPPTRAPAPADACRFLQAGESRSRLVVEGSAM